MVFPEFLFNNNNPLSQLNPNFLLTPDHTIMGIINTRFFFDFISFIFTDKTIKLFLNLKLQLSDIYLFMFSFGKLRVIYIRMILFQ